MVDRKNPVWIDYAPLMRNDDFQVRDCSDYKVSVSNFWSENPVPNSRSEKNRSRFIRSLFWDALGTVVWLLAVVWAVWLGSPIIVTGNDAVVLSALVITVVTTKTYFRWRKLNE